MSTSVGETGKPKSIQANAFIFYRPQSKISSELVFFNDEVRRILSFAYLQSDPDLKVVPELDTSCVSSLCSKWADSLETHLKQGTPKQAEPGGGYLEIFQSYRRRYAVRGILLNKAPSDKSRSSAHKKDKNYLFILERISLEEPTVTILFRQKNLSRREQQIARYLLQGYGNKDIASNLGLSQNTIKGYMKLLMRKLGVNSRSGIIALLLAKKP